MERWVRAGFCSRAGFQYPLLEKASGLRFVLGSGSESIFGFDLGLNVFLQVSALFGGQV